jgi:hypothetical protein
MDGTTPGCEALEETVAFLSSFKELKDPRQQGKAAYPLEGGYIGVLQKFQ